ncbi:MAG: hypothetical protein IMZ55_13780 [Acidobacteria bacterium]|nr:hypothetical protein [Acidobacteriota bacterium]
MTPWVVLGWIVVALAIPFALAVLIGIFRWTLDEVRGRHQERHVNNETVTK